MSFQPKPGSACAKLDAMLRQYPPMTWFLISDVRKCMFEGRDKRAGFYAHVRHAVEAGYFVVDKSINRKHRIARAEVPIPLEIPKWDENDDGMPRRRIVPASKAKPLQVRAPVSVFDLGAM